MCCNILTKIIKQIPLHFYCQALAPVEKTVQKGSRASGILWAFWHVAKGGTISDSDNRENILIESSFDTIKVITPSWFEAEGLLLLDLQFSLGMCFVETFEPLASNSEPDQVWSGSPSVGYVPVANGEMQPKQELRKITFLKHHVSFLYLWALDFGYDTTMRYRTGATKNLWHSKLGDITSLVRKSHLNALGQMEQNSVLGQVRAGVCGCHPSPHPTTAVWSGGGTLTAWGAPGHCTDLQPVCKIPSRHSGNPGKETSQGQNNTSSSFHSILSWRKRKSNLAIEN